MESVAFRLMRVLRDSRLAVPDRTSAQIASALDATSIRLTLEGELGAVLNRVRVCEQSVRPAAGCFRRGVSSTLEIRIRNQANADCLP